MIDKNYFLNQIDQYAIDNGLKHRWSRVRLRYITKKVSEYGYQVIDTETNEPMWTCHASYGENIWYCVMSIEEAEQLIEDLLGEEL